MVTETQLSKKASKDSWLVVIPARGGSKAIPRKNLRPLKGRMLLEHSFDLVGKLDFDFDLVISTDDEEIGALGNLWNLEVMIRDQNLADDFTTIDQVISDVVGKLESLGRHYNHIITIQPTSPCTGIDDLKKAICDYYESSYDTLISVVEDRHLNWSLDVDGKPRREYAGRVNRQELMPRYKETGSFVICKRGNLERGSRIGPNVGIYIMDPKKSVDIDTTDDWVFAEACLEKRAVNIFFEKGSSQLPVEVIHSVFNLVHFFSHLEVKIYGLSEAQDILEHFSKLNFDTTLVGDEVESYLQNISTLEFCIKLNHKGLWYYKCGWLNAEDFIERPNFFFPHKFSTVTVTLEECHSKTSETHMLKCFRQVEASSAPLFQNKYLVSTECQISPTCLDFSGTLLKMLEYRHVLTNCPDVFCSALFNGLFVHMQDHSVFEDLFAFLNFHGHPAKEVVVGSRCFFVLDSVREQQPLIRDFYMIQSRRFLH